MTSLLHKARALLTPADKRKLAGLFLLMFIAGLLEVAGLGLVLVFVSSLADPARMLGNPWLQPVLAALGIASVGSLLVYGSLSLIGLFLFKNAYLLLVYRAQARFVHHRFERLSVGLFEEYMNAPYPFHLQRNTALLVRNVSQEAYILVNQVMISFLTVCMEAVTVACVGIFLLALEPLIALVSIAFIGVAGAFFLRFLKKSAQERGAQAFQHRGEMIRKVNEGLGGIKEITVRHRQEWFVRQFAASASAFASAATFDQVMKSSFKPVVETIAVAGMLFIALILAWQGRGVESVIPVLTLFAAASFKLMPSFDKINNHYGTLRYHGHAITPIYEDLKELGQREKAAPAGAVAPDFAFAREIRAEGLRYAYPDGREVLCGASFTIRKGEAAAFVGPTGGGKTTAADLLIGLLTPDEGRIQVDSTSIQDNLAGWQRNIGYVPQFIYLADTTIRRNIAFGIDESAIREDALARAVKMAQLEDFVASLPDGLDTMVGERGVRLSGGQRQRIGIARALYDDPEVLVMDEATSALDSQTEQYVIEAIERLKKERTIVMIAHRLSTVENCDRVFAVRNGAIEDLGSYREALPKL